MMNAFKSIPDRIWFAARQISAPSWRPLALLLLTSLWTQAICAEDARSPTFGELLVRSPKDLPGKPVVEDNESDGAGDLQADGSSHGRSLAKRMMQLDKPVTDISIGKSSTGKKPENRAAQLAVAVPTRMIGAIGAATPTPQRYASGFCHRPLYFEQFNLERCGQSYGYWQNGVSAVQFLWTTLWLPYHLAWQRPDCPIPSRGDCPTCHSYSTDIDTIGCDHHGLLSEAATIAGFSFLLL